MTGEGRVDEVAEAYITGGKLGLKAVAIYRDGSKRTQPLNTGRTSLEKAAEAVDSIAAGDDRMQRRKLPDERQSITHKLDIRGHEGYIPVRMYEDRTPGKIFVTIAKQVSAISRLMALFATGS